MFTTYDYSEQLYLCMDTYIDNRNTLFKNYYGVYLLDPTVQRYNAREIAFQLYNTIESAQKCYTLYVSIISDPLLSLSQRKGIESQMTFFKNQCNNDHIDYTPFHPRLQEIPYKPENSMNGNLTKTKEQLHLLSYFLNGIAKMGYALHGDYISIIVNRLGYVGVMNLKGQLHIDIDRILTSPPFVGHVSAHEIGHRDDDEYKGLVNTERNISKIDFRDLSFLQRVDIEAEKREVMADMFAATLGAIFNIPFDIVFSYHLHQQRLMNSLLTVQAASRTFDSKMRVEILQKVFSSLKQHIGKTNKFGEKSRWRKFALEVKKRAQIEFKDLPDFEAINTIFQNHPDNKTLQIIILEEQFPMLFQPALSGIYPPAVLVASDLKKKITEINQPGLSLADIAKNNALHPPTFTTVEEFQMQPYEMPLATRETPVTSNVLLGFTLYKMGKNALQTLGKCWANPQEASNQLPVTMLKLCP